MKLKFSSSYLIPEDWALNNKKISLSSLENAGATNPLLLHISCSHKGSLTWEPSKDNQDLALRLKETVTIPNP